MSRDRDLIELIRRYSRPLFPVPPDSSTLEVFIRRCVSGRDTFPSYKAAMFDVYGTLFVSGSGDIGTLGSGADIFPDEPERVRDLLSPYAASEDMPRLKNLFREAVKKRHGELRETVLRGTEDVPEIRVEEIWADLLDLGPEGARDFSLRFELAVNPVHPMPGLELLLERLRGLDIPLGIVSNAQFFTPLLFEAFLGKDLFSLGFSESLCIYSYRECRGKPSPGLFAKAAGELRYLGMSPGEALFIGNDMLNDIWAAGRAGLGTALFAGDKRSLRLREEDPRCIQCCPDHLIKDLREICGLFIR